MKNIIAISLSFWLLFISGLGIGFIGKNFHRLQLTKESNGNGSPIWMRYPNFTASGQSNEVAIYEDDTALKDNFQVTALTSVVELNGTKEIDPVTSKYEPQNTQADPDMTFQFAATEMPLYSEDYYYRKYENAAAGAIGINNIPVLKAGSRIGVIKDKFISIRTYRGFVQPPGYFFGSGVCWSTSLLGTMMDNANKKFKEKYNLDLFVYNSRDRDPHPDSYRTYGGRGWTIMQATEGVPIQDYAFTVNPEISNNPEIADLKLKIVMIATDKHETASHGQSLAAYLLTNKEI